MPKIFELFGFPIADQSAEAQANRKRAHCPFMDAPCDGGGNRYASQVTPTRGSELKKFFPRIQHVHAGVCSLQLQPNARPWIVCPRRLLALGRDTPSTLRHQFYVEQVLLSHSPFVKGSTIGVWSELKVKFQSASEENDDDERGFDYTFDYVLAELGRVEMHEAERMTGISWQELQPKVEKAGFTLARRNGTYWIDDFPVGHPIIIEIMTSSTSGGNKTKRTTIPLCFEDAILGLPHRSPGINYRQVWARMASQLLVKSEVALKWGGFAFWIVQDTLVDYISRSTGLDIRTLVSDSVSEVNMVSLSYGDSFLSQKSGVIELSEGEFYSGEIAPPSRTETKRYFQEIIRISVHPPISLLRYIMLKKGFINKFVFN